MAEQFKIYSCRLNPPFMKMGSRKEMPTNSDTKPPSWQASGGDPKRPAGLPSTLRSHDAGSQTLAMTGCRPTVRMPDPWRIGPRPCPSFVPMPCSLWVKMPG